MKIIHEFRSTDTSISLLNQMKIWDYIQYSSDAQARDLDIVASYEIHFISDTRCDELLKDSLGSSDVAQIWNFSQAVKIGFNHTKMKLVKSEQVGIESLSQSTLFMGCLMNPKVTKNSVLW